MTDHAEFARMTAALRADRDRLAAENEALRRPRTIKCAGGVVSVTVRPDSVEMVAGGVARYVWINAENKIEAAYVPPKG